MENKNIRFFYSFLSPNEKLLYEMLFDGLVQRKTHFHFNIASVNLTAVVEALEYDCPELYHVDNWDLRYTDDELWFESSDPFVYSKSEDAAVRAKLEEIVSSFAHGQSDYRNELAVHNYIVKNCRYDESYWRLKAGSKADLENHSLVGPLIHGVGVCAGFAKAAQYLLLRLGIPAIYCVGKTKDNREGEGHAWLMVKIGGGYYHLDVSHDVCLSKDFVTPRYSYFNVTDEEIKRDHAWNAKGYPITCAATEWNYYRVSGKYYASRAQIREAVAKSLREAAPLADSKRVDFRAAPDITEEAVSAVLTDVMNASHRARAYSVSYDDLNTYSVTFELLQEKV